MKTVYQLPADAEALAVALADPEPKHVWHDVPQGRVIIYTGADIPAEEMPNA